MQVTVREVVAVRCTKYKDKPLLGVVKEVKGDTITLSWLMGSFKGTWRPWTGREKGETVNYTDDVAKKDVILNIKLTPSQRLPASVAAELKKMY
jgi:hypothetical protein